ncbi:hypothetical protein N0V90_002782 [Kalmusia sp. IMI 367209]|nr:hypothetical protein N0V90_002782 [Kalmusia sp. IMI 367209]
MPEKSGAGGWRKRKVIEDPSESLRPQEKSGWRKTIHSRPGTPSRTVTPVPSQSKAEDIRRKLIPEVPSPRKETNPKLSKYLSGYLSLKDASKEIEFAEPWDEETPSVDIPFVDPLVSAQSIYSHMTSVPSRPIPLHCNSGLFQVFDHYRKVRGEKERMDALLQETLEGYRASEEGWKKMVAQYQAEVRRLELLIARGTSGMAG